MTNENQGRTVAVAGVASAVATAHATLTVSAVVDAVRPPGVTRADLDEVIEVLLSGIRESADAGRIARRVEQEAPMFQQLAQLLRTPAGIIAVLSVLLAVASLVRDQVADSTDQPPTVVVVQNDAPTAADVEEIVQRRISELRDSPKSE